ncbi:MAG: hypothetical protein HPY58_02295 [Firmicutes bacterium]|nr:hypothetical protein [Bacillota bacterium]
MDSLLRFVETYGSSSVASTIRKYAGKIADIVDKLLTWADVPLKAIEDQITGGLNGIGVPYSTGKAVGYYIRLFVEWVLL